jgi:hypothetical protein
MLWARMLAYVTGRVNQELLLRNEYLGAENRILRGKIKGRLLLSKGEKATLAEIAHRLGREALENVAATANPDTILGWYRSSSRTSLTDRDFADEQVDRGLMKKSNVWSCKWRKKIPAGATVAWWAP